ncbi:MAG TPA: NAD(P)-dependent oxidoreductase [Polyangiaceae bacterium]|jgi:nucleoside-diphosphate-sugar epimerase|nr:NAD(P)-dependent oxidoreductase [Polyangiaceae bacterium]
MSTEAAGNSSAPSREGGIRVAVSGAAGFVGSHLVRGFDARGARVLPLVRVIDGRSAASARLLGEALVDPAVLAGVEVFVHAAAPRHRPDADAMLHRAENVELVEHALRACARAGVRRFVFVSAVGVYGYPATLPVDESYPYAPRTAYAAGKVDAELRARRIGRDLPIEIVVARPSIVYGPGGHGFLETMASMMRSATYRVVGSGDNVLHHAYVDDVVEGLWLAVTHPGARGEDFILAGPETTTLGALSALVARAVGREVPRRHVPVAVARAVATAFDSASLSGLAFTTREPPLTHEKLDVMTLPIAYDIAKARRLLGFAPSVGYEEGVLRALRRHWPSWAQAGAGT